MKGARKDDAGKLRYSLLPWDALLAVVEVLEFGARKYAAHAWRDVPDAQMRYWDANMRHLFRQPGEPNPGMPRDPWELDSESGLLHAAHAACDSLFYLAFALQAQSKRRSESK